MCFNGGFTRNPRYRPARDADEGAVNHEPAQFIENKRYREEGRPPRVVVNRNADSVYQTECDFAFIEPVRRVRRQNVSSMSDGAIVNDEKCRVRRCSEKSLPR
jgi:hypothetical protein